ncbi:retinoid-inducible serine carboxypeptidase-like [Microplitis mediator]|uniref:retinoid-inducible serine carboxypeptidase-like n=1 Tax=Microplitis mediator TaxID=375433 RepID=UPI002555F2F3|nr:retinoid-inducible serine carboxypeptidase-like [Microplitis mediator]
MSWIRFIFVSCFIFYDKVHEVTGKTGIGPGDQEWGYVNVRPGAHMFWWLHYVSPPHPNKLSNFDVYSKPLLVWLEGGPGGSGTGAGNFLEVGPVDLNLKRRNHTLVNYYNVLFIDNPVGTGFSYVENESAYARKNRQIADDLLECIKKFIEVFPEFKDVPTYIVGESYGPKMGVELASIWYKQQYDGSVTSNLKGLVLGSPLISPIDSALSWAPSLLYAGILDTTDFQRVESEVEKMEQAVKAEKWREAMDVWQATTNSIGKLSDNATIFNILTLGSSHEGVQNYTSCFPRPPVESSKNLSEFMNENVKQTLGLYSHWVKSNKVYENLYEDLLKPVVNIVEELLNETDLKISIYAGQLDALISLPSTIKWVEKLKWKHSSAWKNAPRSAFAVNNIVDGYVKAYGNLKMYWVSRAGHSVATQNPYALNAILQDITALKCEL